MDRGHEITELLNTLGNGGRAAVDRLYPILYKELKAIARRQRRGERSDHTLNTTGLVHEAYVKLIGLDRMSWQNRAHFLAIAAQAIIARRPALLDEHIHRRSESVAHYGHSELEASNLTGLDSAKVCGPCVDRQGMFLQGALKR
jgi:hypothetical protein